ncbi:OmpA family protein [Cellulomonas aerilata]|uniref:OmpA-like domain-containing protein n=1 Tax=Cellulomonas aerilata TaxID=515326 RepID=A0A512D9A6_9CELL|nr:OmpA family protein [Cellulomonas aerilata]GEO32977.1 hypothetical protein CAE01nite_07020 [Cellulomonas aerilata]
MPVRRPVTALAVAATLVSLVGCTGQDATDATDAATGDTSSEAPTPTATERPTAPVVRSFVMGKETVDLEVGPLVVEGPGDSDGDGGIGVLTLRASEGTSRDVAFALGVRLGNALLDPKPGPSAVRLVDPRERTVSLPARGPDDRPVFTMGDVFADEPVPMAVAFAAPSGDTVDVLVPLAGYVADVPVVSAADPSGTGPAVLADITDAPAEDLTARVATLDTYTEQVGRTVRTRTQAEQVTVDIAADVLFAPDSADLGADADAALAAAGAQIAAYPGGTLVVVGHTDDVASDAYNVDLSVRRAQAARDRLGSLVDLGAYGVTVEGRGESEPAAPGRDDAARAANRRVELRFIPAPDADPEPATASAAPTGMGTEPAADGPVATGAEGVRVGVRDGVEFEVRLPEVRRVGEVLVGEVEVEQTAGDRAADIGSLLSSGVWDGRGEFDATTQSAATNLTLLDGGTRVFPFDYVRNDDGDRHPLADRFLTSPVGVGQVQTVTVVWPAAPGDTVTVDSAATPHAGGPDAGGPPFRLTDVPVRGD